MAQQFISKTFMTRAGGGHGENASYDIIKPVGTCIIHSLVYSIVYRPAKVKLYIKEEAEKQAKQVLFKEINNSVQNILDGLGMLFLNKGQSLSLTVSWPQDMRYHEGTCWVNYTEITE